MHDHDDSPFNPQLRRRHLLTGGAALLLAPVPATAHAGVGASNLTPESPPEPVRPGPWQFFTDAEARTVEAIADRLIPPDPQTPGGKDAGCAVFIDRQLAGPYGAAVGLYMQGPFQPGSKSQGAQASQTPSQLYLAALRALDAHCTSQFGGRDFASLAIEQQDALLHQLEGDEVKLGEVAGKAFFAQILQNTQEGFFADPVHGGNRDMAGWKMIGFPGARYDHRFWVEHHNETYPLPPVSIATVKT